MPRCRGGLVTFVTYRRPGLPSEVSRNHGSCRPSPVTLSKAPCRVSLVERSKRDRGFSLDLRLPRNTTYRSSDSPFGTSQSYGLPLTELNIGYRSKYKRDYPRAGDCTSLSCWLGDLFMDHKASASASDCRLSLPSLTRHRKTRSWQKLGVIIQLVPFSLFPTVNKICLFNGNRQLCLYLCFNTSHI